jgi:hypothetical protein
MGRWFIQGVESCIFKEVIHGVYLWSNGND